MLLSNGDHLSGRIVRKTGNSVVLETSYAGAIRIELKEILRLDFDDSRTLLISGNEAPNVVSLERVDDGVRVGSSDAAEPLIVAFEAVSTPAPGTTASSIETEFSGRVNVAVKEESGNSEETEVDVDYLMLLRRGNNRLRSDGIAEIDSTEGARTKQDWRFTIRLDHFLSQKTYVGFQNQLKQEKFADLNLRVSAGPLVGYQFYQSHELNLLGELLISFVNEDYREQSDQRFWGPGWNIDFDRFVFKERLQFYHTENAFISVKDTDKLLWHAYTGLRMPLLHGFVVSTEVEFDYDGQPAVEAESLDTTFRLKLGYQW